MKNTDDTTWREGMPGILNAEKYEKLRECYGTRGPVDRRAFCAEFAKDPYGAVTWLHAAGGEFDPAEMEKAKAEDARYSVYLRKNPRRSRTTCNPVNHVSLACLTEDQRAKAKKKREISKESRLRNRQKQD